MTADRCTAVQFSDWGVVRCSQPAGHQPNRRGDVWHSGSGWMVDEDGEPDVFGTAWRYMPELTQ